jgi:general secretion pathway protein F
MEAFRYQALDATGRAVSGEVQADTPREARAQLRARGLLPSIVAKPVLHAWTRAISAGELSLLTRQLATLLESGLTMEQALAALIEEAEVPVTRAVLTRV